MDGWGRSCHWLHPSEAHCSAGVAAGVNPVVFRLQLWIFCSHNNPDRVVREVLRSPFVDVDWVITVVQRFHPIVVELKVPGGACRWGCINHQCLTFLQLPIRVEVAYVRVASDVVGTFLVEKRELVWVLIFEPFGPPRKPLHVHAVYKYIHIKRASTTSQAYRHVSPYIGK